MYILSPMIIVLYHRRLYMTQGYDMYILSPVRIDLCHRWLYISRGCNMYKLSPVRHLVLRTASFITQPFSVHIFVHIRLPAQIVTVHLQFLVNCYTNSAPVNVSAYCQQPQYYRPYKTVKFLDATEWCVFLMCF